MAYQFCTADAGAVSSGVSWPDAFPVPVSALSEF
jgi:hypothetical protein